MKREAVKNGLLFLFEIISDQGTQPFQLKDSEIVKLSYSTLHPFVKLSVFVTSWQDVTNLPPRH